MDTTTEDVNPLLVVASTLALVVLGLAVIVITVLFPSLIFVAVSPTPLLPFLIVCVAVQVLHIHQLWTNPDHLAFYRWLALPIRRFVAPIVILSCRLDSIREREPTMYLPIDNLRTDALAGNEKTALLLTFRASVRRRHRQMEQLFMESGLKRRSVQSESKLNLSQVVPIMWRHIRGQCQQNDKGFVGEFLKRFLVVALLPDAVLDLYRQETREESALPTSSSNPVVAVQMSLLQGDCLHLFMYFSLEHTAGIWFQTILLNMTRGVQLPNVKYVNVHTHHESSKRNAGFLVADPTTQHALLKELYPTCQTQQIPLKIVRNSSWEMNEKSPN